MHLSCHERPNHYVILRAATAVVAAFTGMRVGRVAMRTVALLATTIFFFGASLAAALSGGGGNFDRLSDADRQTFEERFTKEIWPTLQRGAKKGCFECHGPTGKGGGQVLKFKGDSAKDFRMLLKEGFFIPGDSGSILTRITSTNKKEQMPPPGKGDRVAKSDVEL